MADPIIKIKRSSVANKVPTPTDLQLGELAINTNDAKVYLEQQSGITTVVCVNPWSVGLGSTGYNINFKRGHVGVGTDLHVSILTVGDVGDFVPWRGSLAVKTTPSSGTVAESAIYLEEQVGNEGWYFKVNVNGDLIFNNSGSATESFEFMDNDHFHVRKGNVGILTDTAADALVVNGNAKVIGVATVQGNVSLDAGLYDINNVLGTDGQVLTSTGAGVSWKTSSGGAAALDDLTDVTITTASTNNVLSYNGSQWVNTNQINLSGVGTFSEVKSTQLNVTGVSTFGGNMNIDAGLIDINNSLGSDTYVLTSTGAGVSWAAASGSAGVSTHKHITTYGTGTQTNTTEVTADLDLTAQTSGSGDFTVSAGGVITVVNAGRYLVHYSVTTDVSSGTARSGTYVYIRLNGSGEVTASRSYMYNRLSTVGADTASKQIVMNLAANDTLELRSARYAGTDTTVVNLDYSTFTIESIEYVGGSGGGGGGASALNDLTDVTLTSPTNGQVLKYNGSVWVNDTDATGGGGGDGGTFNTGITTSLYHSVTSGIGANQTEDNNIFIGPGVAYTFPATAGKRYIVESIQLANITTQDAYVVARHDFSGLTDVPIAQRVIVPYRGALELLEHPIVFNPSDELRLQAMDGLASTANGLNNAIDAFIVWTEKSDTAYIGTGATLTTTDQSIYTASSQTVIETVSVTNFSLTEDRNVSVSIYRGVTRLGYLCKDLPIPKNSVIDVIEKPKYLAIGDKIAFDETSGFDQVSCRIAGKTY